MNRHCPGQRRISAVEYGLLALAVAAVIVIGVWSLNNGLVAGMSPDTTTCGTAEPC
ncbi:MAG: Flp family type IVb pilin [Jiangellaceae bacterium]